jgi:hypothetical protein
MATNQITITWPEDPADRLRPPALHREQRRQDRHRDRDHERPEARGRDVESLHRRQHRDRRRDDAVAVEQRRADDAQQSEHRATGDEVPRRTLDERRQRHDAALAVVVGAHDERDVLDRDDQGNRPEHERHHAIDVRTRGTDHAAVQGEHGLDRVERAGADVAEDDAEGGKRQAGEPRRRVAHGTSGR